MKPTTRRVPHPFFQHFPSQLVLTCPSVPQFETAKYGGRGFTKSLEKSVLASLQRWVCWRRSTSMQKVEDRCIRCLEQWRSASLFPMKTGAEFKMRWTGVGVSFLFYLVHALIKKTFFSSLLASFRRTQIIGEPPSAVLDLPYLQLEGRFFRE